MTRTDQLELAIDDPCASAQRKFKRAIAHGHELGHLGRVWLDEHGTRTVSIEHDESAGEFVFRVPPVTAGSLDDLGPVLGDYCGNLRACLDHLFFQLKQRGSRRASRSVKSQNFPIFTDSGWISKREELEPFIPADALSIIDAVQPVNAAHAAPDGVETHPLNLLGWVENKDKHRLVRPVAQVPAGQFPIFGRGRHELGDGALQIVDADGVFLRIQADRPVDVNFPSHVSFEPTIEVGEARRPVKIKPLLNSQADEVDYIFGELAPVIRANEVTYPLSG